MGIVNLTDSLSNNVSSYGKILTVKFKKPEYLSKSGDILFSATKDSGSPVQDNNPDMLQGFIEGSNVNIIKDMAEMINVSQIHSNMIAVLKSYSHVNNTAINTIGAPV